MIAASKGPFLRYDGNMAGLVGAGKKAGGDVNSEFDHSIICGCGAYIGVLGAFQKNESGQRSPYCPECKHLIIVSKEGQIVHYSPYDIAQRKK